MLGDLGLSHFVRMSRSNDDPEAIDTMGTRTYGGCRTHFWTYRNILTLERRS